MLTLGEDNKILMNNLAYIIRFIDDNAEIHQAAVKQQELVEVLTKHYKLSKSEIDKLCFELEPKLKEEKESSQDRASFINKLKNFCELTEIKTNSMRFDLEDIEEPVKKLRSRVQSKYYKVKKEVEQKAE